MCEIHEGFYVYAYLDPRKESEEFGNEPFYIGRGKGDRYLSHLKEASKFKSMNLGEIKTSKGLNFFKINKINSIRKETNNDSIITILKSNLTLKESQEYEKELIRRIGISVLGLGPLTNLTMGGEFVNRAICSGPLNNFYGRTHTDETKAKISKIHKGKVLSIEQREKISKSNKGREKSLEAKKAYSEQMKLRFQHSPNDEIFQRLGKRNSKKWKILSPDGQEFLTESLRKFCQEFSISEKTLISAFNDNQREVFFGKSAGWKILEKIE